MDKTPAAETEDLRNLQDRWLSLPSVRERIRREGWSARIAGDASPTFREVFDAPRYAWASWFAAEVEQAMKRQP